MNSLPNILLCRTVLGLARIYTIKKSLKAWMFKNHDIRYCKNNFYIFWACVFFFFFIFEKKITAEIAIYYRKLTKENIRSNVRPVRQKLGENIIQECSAINEDWPVSADASEVCSDCWETERKHLTLLCGSESTTSPHTDGLLWSPIYFPNTQSNDCGTIWVTKPQICIVP